MPAYLDPQADFDLDAPPRLDNDVALLFLDSPVEGAPLQRLAGPDAAVRRGCGCWDGHGKGGEALAWKGGPRVAAAARASRLHARQAGPPAAHGTPRHSPPCPASHARARTLQEPAPGERLRAAGWGRVPGAGLLSPDQQRLLTTELEAVSLEECRDWYAAYNQSGLIDPDGGDLCAGSSAANGTCSGDSGGPLLAPDGTQVGGTRTGSGMGGCGSPAAHAASGWRWAASASAVWVSPGILPASPASFATSLPAVPPPPLPGGRSQPRPVWPAGECRPAGRLRQREQADGICQRGALQGLDRWGAGRARPGAGAGAGARARSGGGGVSGGTRAAAAPGCAWVGLARVGATLYDSSLFICLSSAAVR